MLIDTSVADYKKYSLKTEEKVSFDCTIFKDELRNASTTMKEIYSLLELPFGYKNFIVYIQKGKLPKSIWNDVENIVPGVKNAVENSDHNAYQSLQPESEASNEAICEIDLNNFNAIPENIIALLERKIEEWHMRNDMVTITDRFGLNVTMNKGDFMRCWNTLIKSNIRISYIYNGLGFDRDPMYKAPIYNILVVEKVSIVMDSDTIELKYKATIDGVLGKVLFDA